MLNRSQKSTRTCRTISGKVAERRSESNALIKVYVGDMVTLEHDEYSLSVPTEELRNCIETIRVADELERRVKDRT